MSTQARNAEAFAAYRPINEREYALRLLAPPLAHAFVQFTCRFQGKRVHGLEHAHRTLDEHGNAIFAFWHNRFFMSTFWWRWLFAKRPVCAIISRSLDGEILARMVRFIRAEAIRGSDFDGGVAALKTAAGKLGDGVNLCITPDGPRGPKYKVKPGTVALARLAGKPIVPIAYDCTRKLLLDSWDDFIVPLVGGHTEFCIGEPILVDRSRSPEAWAAHIEECLMTVTDRSEALARSWGRGLPHVTRRRIFPNPHRQEKRTPRV